MSIRSVPIASNIFFSACTKFSSTSRGLMVVNNCFKPSSYVRHCSTESAPVCRDGTTYARDKGRKLEVYSPEWPHSLTLSYIWLRDHCRCTSCYSDKTYQKLSDICTIPLNIRPSLVTAETSKLNIEWTDSHKTEYGYDFLWKNTYEGIRSSAQSKCQLWTAEMFPELQDCSVPYNEVFNRQENGLKKLFRSLRKYGVAFLDGVAPDADSTNKAILEVSAIRRTFFGDIWKFEASLDSMEHLDSAYSNDSIGPHTDNTYFMQASRIQVFHSLLEGVSGGENILVDGFAVAQEFKDRHPEGYKFLSSTPLTSEYYEPGQHHVCTDTLLKHHPVTQDIMQIRFNMHDLAPISTVPSSQMHELYLHLRNLNMIVRNLKYQHVFKLKPGSVMFLDNWRVMHGRKSFSGRRIICGCYLDNEDFHSRAGIIDEHF